jgi:hypothetical protein
VSALQNIARNWLRLVFPIRFAQIGKIGFRELPYYHLGAGRCGPALNISGSWVPIKADGLADISGGTYIGRHINDFLWELRSVDEWQLADERNNREKITRARQAAEELFKPAPHRPDVTVPQSASNKGTANDQPPRRQPRIFTVPPRIAPSSRVEPPVPSAPARREGLQKRRKMTVPSSQIGRVRALATYGMTPQQVADLYGVTADEIDRILKTPAYTNNRR